MNLAKLMRMRGPRSTENHATLPKAGSVCREAKIEIWPQARLLRLEGELGMLVSGLGFLEVQNVVKECLSGEDAIVIDATAVTLIPTEVEAWVNFVEAEFMHCELRYLASQLTEVLRYHEGYDHPKSSFDAEDLECEVKHIEFAVLNRRELSNALYSKNRRVKSGDNDNFVLNLSRAGSCIPA